MQLSKQFALRQFLSGPTHSVSCRAFSYKSFRLLEDMPKEEQDK